MSIIRYQTPDLSAWRSLDRWSTLRDEINHLFDGNWSGPTPQAQLFNGWTPALDLYQTNDDVIALVELPGLRKEDIELSLHNGMLVISGERKDDGAAQGGKTSRSERFVGKFRRSIALPTRVDSNRVQANYKDGILTVTLPKAEEAKPKQIQVNVD